MGILGSSRAFPATVADLAPVAEDVMAYFRERGYEVAGATTPTGGWHISLTKGGLFTRVAGMNPALKLDIERQGDAIVGRTSIGLIQQQALPAVIASRLFPPLLAAQVWGVVQQYQLDDEVLRCLERSLIARTRGAAPFASTSASASSSESRSASASASSSGSSSAGGARRAVVEEVTPKACNRCGARVSPSLRFCPECGALL